MIQKVQLVNFQRHENLVLEFDPLVTVLWGDTEAGKSSIVRGLQWICLNEPSGVSFIRHGTEEAIGRLWLDGKKVVRRRGKENTYWMSGMEGTARLRAFHSSVPKEVADLLNLQPINFQQQFDMPFWFTETAPQVSRNLNHIINLAAIDSTLSGLATEVRKARSTAEVTRERLEAAVKRRDELGWVESFNAGFDALWDDHQAWAGASSSSAALALLVSEASRVKVRRDRAATAALEGEKVVSLGQSAVTLRDRRRRLSDLLTDVESTQLLMEEEVPDFEGLAITRREGDVVAERRRMLEAMVEQLQQAEDKVCQSQSELKQVEAEMQQALKGKCPLCGNLLPEDQCGSSPAPIYTSGRTRRLLGKKKTGSESWPDTSDNSGP